MLLRRVFLDVNINKLVTYLQPVFFLIKLKNKSVESREIKKKNLLLKFKKKEKSKLNRRQHLFIHIYICQWNL